MSDNLARIATMLRDLAEIAGDELRQVLKLDQEQSEELGLRIAQRFCDEWGGQMVYIPSGYTLRLSQRDREMHDEYVRSGRDIGTVARKFSVSIHTAYRRIRLIEADDHATRQPGLFQEGEGTD